MASDSSPVRVTITSPADGSDGLNPANVVVSGSNDIDYAVCRKIVARDVFGREFPGSLREQPDSSAWSATFSELPPDKWLVIYAEFQRPGYDDIGSGVISIRCSDRSRPRAIPHGAKPVVRKPRTTKRKSAKNAHRPSRKSKR